MSLNIIKSNLYDVNIMPEMIERFWTVSLFIILLSISFEDLKSMNISAIKIKAGYIIGIIFNLTFVYLNDINIYKPIIINNLFSSLLFFIIMKLIALISYSIFQKKCLGDGDIKLTSLSALWIGFEGISLAISIAFVSAAIFSLIAITIRKLRSFQPFPFAPFISTSVIMVWSLGTNFWINRWFELRGL
tara:strand:+ start:63 stop:629 length:567 start_codon:yes stop_codon:yes gene_type:complete